MATFNFYLRDANAKETTPIVLFISSQGVVSKISTGESIEPRNWDKKRQQVKKSYVGSPELNEFLNSFILRAQGAYRAFTTANIQPTSDQLRKAIELPKKKSNAEFKNALDLFISQNKNTKQPSTIRKYNSLSNHLTKFQNQNRKTLSFEMIDLDFHQSFINFLVSDLKQNNNTVCKYVKALKSFMQWALDREYHNNMTFKKFKASEYSVDITYLTEKEVLKIYELALSENKTLDRVRDAFCFGCFTGQRFSDIHNIQWEDIKNGTWFLNTKKTRDLIEIPLNKYALAIIKKYKDRPKPVEAFSNQKMNDHLKDLAKLAELDEKQKLISYNGNKKIETTEFKYNLVTTHTARRTFVTLSLEKGMRPETVMEITGHRDYKTLKRYIKITSKVKALEMKKIWDSK